MKEEGVKLSFVLWAQPRGTIPSLGLLRRECVPWGIYFPLLVYILLRWQVPSG